MLELWDNRGLRGTYSKQSYTYDMLALVVVKQRLVVSQRNMKLKQHIHIHIPAGLPLILYNY